MHKRLQKERLQSKSLGIKNGEPDLKADEDMREFAQKQWIKQNDQKIADLGQSLQKWPACWKPSFYKGLNGVREYKGPQRFL